MEQRLRYWNCSSQERWNAPKGPWNSALRYWNAPKGPWNSALRYWNAPKGLTLCAKLAFQRS